MLPVSQGHGAAAKPPLFIDLPLENGKLVPAILIKWSANSPLVMLDQYVPALKGYRALFIDAGDEDLPSPPPCGSCMARWKVMESRTATRSTTAIT